MKRIFALFIAFSVWCYFSFTAFGETEIKQAHSIDNSVTDSFLLWFGSVSTPYLEFETGIVPLYCEYDQPEEAWSKFITVYDKKLVQILKTDNIVYSKNTDTIVSLYYQETGDKEASEILRFFDLYENKGKNDDIKDLVDKMMADELNEESIKNTLALILPQNSVFLYEMHRSMSSDYWSFSDGYNYANTYYSFPNISYRDFTLSGGDCTNFASQIRYAGGRAMTTTWSYTNFTTFTPAWVGADSFSKYLLPRIKSGYSNPTTSFQDFTRIINIGDFISCDRDGDGDYEHVGFITDADDYNDLWLVQRPNGEILGSLYYWDFEVAQHSTNYKAWASSSNLYNGWDLLPYDYPYCKYYVIKA